jgi:hypothetical protein
MVKARQWPTRGSMIAWCAGVSLGAVVGCGGSPDTDNASGEIVPIERTSAATTTTATETNPAASSTQTTPTAETPFDDSRATETTAAGPSRSSEAAAASCEATGANTACINCVCEKCATPLAECSRVPGCPAILDCVAASGCSGNDCYCGDTSLAACLAGRANGPCKAVILAAPEAREPDSRDPSGGPASDAANRVGDCANDSDTCRAECRLDDD